MKISGLKELVANTPNTPEAKIAAKMAKDLENTAAPIFEKIIGKSAPMQDVFALIRRLSGSSANVLITGESGTGKELVARALHFNSPRAKTRSPPPSPSSSPQRPPPPKT